MRSIQHTYHGKTVDSPDVLLTGRSISNILSGKETHLGLFDKNRKALTLSISIKDRLLDYCMDKYNIYYLTADHLTALDKQNLRTAWKKRFDDAIKLTAVNGSVYCHTHTGICGINPLDGSQISFYQAPSDSQLMIAGEIIVLISHDIDKSERVIGSSMQGVRNDQRLWIKHYKPYLGRVCVLHDTLFRSVGSHLIQIDPSSGKESWSISNESKETYRPLVEAVIDGRKYIIAMPEIVSDSNYGNLAAVSVDSGDIKWRLTCGYRYFYPAIDANNILCAAYVDSKTASDHSLSWDHKPFYSGTGNLNVVALDIETGRLLWRRTATLKPVSSVYSRSSSDYENRLIMSGNNVFLTYRVSDGENLIVKIDKDTGRVVEKTSVASCPGACRFIYDSDEEVLFCNGKDGFSSFAALQKVKH